MLDNMPSLEERRQAMLDQMIEQKSGFPMRMEGCRRIDFHFNTGFNQFPDILPMWILKVRGRTFYIHHMSATLPWSTREIPDGSTKGMLCFRNCDLAIDENGEAIISPMIHHE